MTEYWYNVRTHEVEEDRQSDWSQLIGPYPTRDEAAKALEKVRQRNEAWDAEDEED
ncbi:SPOR domain-containing protein [Arthrobacter sp. RIT-PI-e]|uniref:SPOR domain-containing protein n=1 Tax=Arthrobacter sp. RIT-PI-e TaxID=1681197 RepID=UPI000AC0B518|nr:SPOR domain-containing protein [Arthrobacter sp. RIT-PI-e]